LEKLWCPNFITVAHQLVEDAWGILRSFASAGCSTSTDSTLKLTWNPRVAIPLMEVFHMVQPGASTKHPQNRPIYKWLWINIGVLMLNVLRSLCSQSTHNMIIALPMGSHCHL
jgi:hypothetical protein